LFKEFSKDKSTANTPLTFPFSTIALAAVIIGTLLSASIYGSDHITFSGLSDAFMYQN